MIDVIEAFCNRSIKDGKVDNFLHTLPLLHLLRQDVKPYEPAQHGKDFFNPQWWGLQGLDIDYHFLQHAQRYVISVRIMHVESLYTVHDT